MNFEVVGEIKEIVTIAIGSSIRDLPPPSSCVRNRSLAQTEGNRQYSPR